MNIPTIEFFFGLIQKYNMAIWPMHIANYLIATLIIILAIKKTEYSDKIISGGLAFLWLWVGIVFHIIFFGSEISQLYFITGLLFILQAILFLFFGVFKTSLSYRFSKNSYCMLGTIFILYAVVFYDLIEYLSGHIYAHIPIAGVFPCPVTVLTFGLLMLSDIKMPKLIVIVPFLWSLTGLIAVFGPYHIWSDGGLFLIGVIGAFMLLRRKEGNKIVNKRTSIKEEKMLDKKRIKKEKNFWDNLSSKYDTFIQKYWKIYETSLLNKIADDVETDSTILDVACGTGLVSFEAAKKAKKVYGIDIAPSMIEEAKKKTREMEIKNVEFSVEDAYKLPFDNNRFDTVICNNALHNMKYPEDVLSEIKRVLKPGGRLIAIIVGVGESFKFKIALTLSTLIGQLPVFHKLKLDEFADFINKSGFTVVKKERIKHPEDRMALLYVVAERE